MDVKKIAQKENILKFLIINSFSSWEVLHRRYPSLKNFKVSVCSSDFFFSEISVNEQERYCDAFCLSAKGLILHS